MQRHARHEGPGQVPALNGRPRRSARRPSGYLPLAQPLIAAPGCLCGASSGIRDAQVGPGRHGRLGFSRRICDRASPRRAGSTPPAPPVESCPDLAAPGRPGHATDRRTAPRAPDPAPGRLVGPTPCSRHHQPPGPHQDRRARRSPEATWISWPAWGHVDLAADSRPRVGVQELSVKQHASK